MEKEYRYNHSLQYLFGFILIIFSACDQADNSTISIARPNVLWIIAEDLSPDLACYGYDGVLTPNLDRLAANGIRFEKAFTTAPVCAPSRTALAVGMYQTAINAHHMRYPDRLKNELPAEVLPLNEIYRRSGYQTAIIKDAPGRGKTDWSFASEFAKYDAYHWKELSVEKPFFGVVNLRLTHRPFERDTLNPVDPSQVKVPPYYPNHKVAQEDFAQYLESVQLMDGLVGQVLDSLEQNGLKENTIVIFLGDHGRPMSRGKNNLYDSGMQIPLIMTAPSDSKWALELQKGTTYKPLVSAIDITASSLAFAGIEKPEWMQGRVLFGSDQEAERQEVYCALDRIGESEFKSRAVRTQKWKYIKNYNRETSINEMATAYRKAMHPIYHLLNIYDEKGMLNEVQKALVQPMPEEELYDLENDPFEINNLAGQADFAGPLQEMQGKLEQWQRNIKDYGMDADSKALIEAFEQYGIKSGNNYKEKMEAMEAEVRNAIISE